MKRELSFKTNNEILDVNKTTEVYRHLGPGLLESAYEECLCEELSLRKIPFKRQISLPVHIRAKNLILGIELTCWSMMRL